MAFKQIALWVLLVGLAMKAIAVCPTDGSTTGIVEASVYGIEIQSHCTYIIIGNVNSSFSNHDSNPFVAGRFKYLAIDPENSHYDAMVSIASMAFATNTRIYADVTSRLARVNKLSFSSEENDNQ